MKWNDVRWTLPLGRTPVMRGIGIGVHGRQSVERYCLPEFWSLHVYRYHAELLIDGKSFPIRPGFASITPANAQMEYRLRGRSVHIFVHFRFSRAAIAKKL